MSLAQASVAIPVSYVLPYRSDAAPTSEFVAYLNWLADAVERLIVVDGSADARFAALSVRLATAAIHVRPDPAFGSLANGKVRGVLTGLQFARHERVVIADDDVRYSSATLAAVAAALDSADVVRPQNVFAPHRWHTTIDTARILINRVTGGDWPGTLAVRRSTLARAGGYDGNVLFENLELVRTVQAVGGRAVLRPDLFVRRIPPSTRHFWRQRLRQAYDEFARPARLVAALGVLPLLVLATWQEWRVAIAAIVVLTICLAEAGRQRQGGAAVFPWWTTLFAPIWVVERGVCAWFAVVTRVAFGGVIYNGRRLTVAAHSRRTLERRLRAVGSPTRLGSREARTAE